MAASVEHAREDRRPPNLREKAYRSFTRHLLAREIRAGQFVSQRELVELTGLPLGAIRQQQTRLTDSVVIPTMREHLAIIEAVATRDPEQASNVMRRHILGARDRAIGLR